MKRLSRNLLVLILAFAPSGAALAEATTQKLCDVVPEMPANLKKWHRSPHERSGFARATTENELRFDAPLSVKLDPQETVRFLIEPTQTTASDPNIKIGHFYGGVFQLNIPKSGTYGIAINTKAWIDVIKDGQVIPSERRELQPVCSDVHKVVYFKLSPGAYTIQVANSRSELVQLLPITE